MMCDCTSAQVQDFDPCGLCRYRSANERTDQNAAGAIVSLAQRLEGDYVLSDGKFIPNAAIDIGDDGRILSVGADLPATDAPVRTVWNFVSGWRRACGPGKER